jgi:hypothetical protein
MALVIGLLGTRPIRKLLNGISVPFFAKLLLTGYSHPDGCRRQALERVPRFETAAPEIRYR